MFCFPGTPVNVARFVCERVRANVEKDIFCWDGQEIRVTISVGVADSTEMAEPSPHAIIGLAGRRLYEAKNAGRNRVV